MQVLSKSWPRFLIWAIVVGRPALIPIASRILNTRNRERRLRCCRQLDLMRFVPHGISLYVHLSGIAQRGVHHTIGFLKYFTTPACLSTTHSICCKVKFFNTPIEFTTLIRGSDNWKQETRTRQRQRPA